MMIMTGYHSIRRKINTYRAEGVVVQREEPAYKRTILDEAGVYPGDNRLGVIC